MNGQHRQYDIRMEQTLGFNAAGVASVLSTPEAEVSFIRISPGGEERKLLPEGAEEHAFVVSGTLTYFTGPCRDVQVGRGGWVTARSGEVGGYANRSDRPVLLFSFRLPSAHAVFDGGSRIHRADENRSSHQVIFATPISRGDLLCLLPGAPEALPSALCRGTLVTEGRVMALIGGERIALEAGEGLAFARQSVEFVGVGGQSRVAVFSTTA